MSLALGHPDLRSKVVLVTGASRGIGAAAARHLGRCGATVILAARRQAAAAEVADRITGEGGSAEALALDVTDDGAVAEVVSTIEKRYDALHLAFNNAGTQGPAVALHEQDPVETARIIDTNLMGVYRCMRHQIPAMLRAGGGVVLNTSSVGGSVAAPGIGPYCASKHAVIGLSKSAALDYARLGVRVNVLSPGAVKTDILTGWLTDEEQLEAMAEGTPQGVIAEPEDLAPLVGWLLSDATSFMTGAVVTADGGYTAM